MKNLKPLARISNLLNGQRFSVCVEFVTTNVWEYSRNTVRKIRRERFILRKQPHCGLNIHTVPCKILLKDSQPHRGYINNLYPWDF